MEPELGVAIETKMAEEDVPRPKVIEVERKFVIDEGCEEKLKTLGAELICHKSFHDVYYDTADYKLTLSDFWLRLRDKAWQLKCPPSKRAEEVINKTTQYVEYDNEEDIVRALCPLLCPHNSSATPLQDMLQSARCEEFASYQTDRKSYALDGLSIDLDGTDFGFQVGEIEALVVEESRINDALRCIDELAEKLGMYHVHSK